MNPHLETPASWFGAAPADARLGVVLLHGRGQSPAHMEEQVVRRLGLSDVCYLAPLAAGSTWYPAKFLAPREDNEPSLTWALEAVAAAVTKLSSLGFAPHRQAIVGFSQGACLAADYTFHAPHRFAAIGLLTGGLIGPQGTRWPAAPRATLEGVQVLLGGSEEDPWVPAWRMKETEGVFAAAGARALLRLFSGAAHEVPDAQVELLRELLT
jgi:phospholipase/carboxylesterase